MIRLLLGGARSGKSVLGEAMAASLPGPVSFLATATLDPDDTDFTRRVELHRRRRPAAWRTVEAGTALCEAVGATGGTLLIDSLGSWVAGATDFEVDAEGLCTVLAERSGDAIVVSEEVGLGVHPSTEVGRRYRDALGVVNQAVAVAADDVMLVVAGRALRLDRW